MNCITRLIWDESSIQKWNILHCDHGQCVSVVSLQQQQNSVHINHLLYEIDFKYSDGHNQHLKAPSN